MTSASTRAAADGIVSNQIANPAATIAYWTPARMASAKPVTSNAVAESGSAPAVAKASGTPGTLPSYVPPNLPRADAGPAVKLGSGVSPRTQSYHVVPPFTRYFYFARYRTYPTSTVGKLFFTNNGNNYVCSGSTQYIDVVATAGHCVSNTDGTHLFSTNVLFCPSYNAGINPAVGCWAATQLFTFVNWNTNNSFEWDMGMIHTATSGTVINDHIGNATGYLGLAWNQGYDQNWYMFGYPQGSPFNGNFLVTCNSEFGYQDSDGNNQSGPNSAAAGCDMTGGSSGGPWILAFGSGNYLNGHQDWFHNAFPTEINTPYYDDRICTLVNAAGRPCP